MKIIVAVLLISVLGIAILILPWHLANRRMSANATSAAQALKTLIEAQELYHRKDHDGDGRQEYAFTLAELERASLLSKDIAAADCDRPDCKPYNGYVFRVLTAQGTGAPGGSKLWTDKKGELTFAHGAAAFPNEYGVTGKDHFFISSAGTIYQIDIGAEKTNERDTQLFNPPPWPGDYNSEAH